MAAAASSSSSTAPSNAAASSSASVTEEAETPLRRLHILPFAEAHDKLQGRSRLEFLAPELRRLRASKAPLKMGDLMRHEGLDFAVIKCEPLSGPLGLDTEFFLDGGPLVSLEKVQFTAWGPSEKTTEALFTDCVVPHFRGDYAPYGSPSTKCVRLLYVNQVFQVGDVHLQVDASVPQGLGVVTKDTEIFANWDTTPEFEKVQFVPFQDTLPRAYNYGVFQDYLKPYLAKNAHRKFQVNEIFTYQGVQFKLVACEPDVLARVGPDTEIFCDGTLDSSMRNLLPPEMLAQVEQLPPGLQRLLLTTERSRRELEDVLAHRRGLFDETLSEIEKFSWPPPDADRVTQSSCMVCLGDFEIADEVRRLPCRHVFHASCIDEWLRRCTDCPICKDNVDRAIRHY